jgi:hypothetical protein
MAKHLHLRELLCFHCDLRCLLLPTFRSVKGLVLAIRVRTRHVSCGVDSNLMQRKLKPHLAVTI